MDAIAKIFYSMNDYHYVKLLIVYLNHLIIQDYNPTTTKNIPSKIDKFVIKDLGYPFDLLTLSEQQFILR
ncbi:hypothetical protein DERP_002178 [Dermatophagoides pteronyssinus]|uniref:Uncharacterized protein n=1 Tax=Dermatophagoides pteronyssinus TaxID=6956 RepID=A0ABQ8JH09_DERPT|nr:hypothetical protein DERP_002178 [Dermatophagoides pteronyssinus]